MFVVVVAAAAAAFVGRGPAAMKASLFDCVSDAPSSVLSFSLEHAGLIAVCVVQVVGLVPHGMVVMRADRYVYAPISVLVPLIASAIVLAFGRGGGDGDAAVDAPSAAVASSVADASAATDQKHRTGGSAAGSGSAGGGAYKTPSARPY
jgi:hypothetical protein